jgi:signal peptidase II
MKSLLWRYVGLLAIAGVVITTDQWTKSMLRGFLAVGQTWPAEGWLLLIFKLVRAQNTGAAFSLGRGLGLVFTLLAVAVALGILIYLPRLPKGQPLLFTGVSLLLGGTLGNLIDRLTFGQVTDFLAIRYFAIVNVADISITFGAGMLMLGYYLAEREQAQNPIQSTPKTGD